MKGRTELEKNKILMVVIIALLVILLAAIAFLGFSVSKFLSGPKDDNTEVTDTTEISVPVDKIQTVNLSRPIATNLLKGADGASHNISVNPVIGVNITNKKEGEKIVTLLTEKESIVRDICGDIVRSKTYEELSRPDGKDLLCQEILERLQEEFSSDLIYQVYADDFILP